MSVTYREYWTEVDRIAEELSSTPEELEASYGSAEPSEVLIEIVENHEFVIYYAKALKVLEYTDNADAYFELYDAPPQVDSFTALLPPLAYYAFETDIMDRMSRANPTHAHSRGYGHGARSNHTDLQHVELRDYYRRAADTWSKVSDAAQALGDERVQQLAGQERSSAYAQYRYNAKTAGEPFSSARADAQRALRRSQSAERSQVGKAQRAGVSNPPRKWTREKQPNGLTIYVKSYQGAGTCFVVAYKPRKSPLAREYAADYERQRGRKIPKGTKWLSCFKSVGRTDMIIGAHKSLKAAKALCDSNGGIRSNPGYHSAPKRKSAKSNPPRFKVKVKSSSKAKPKLVQVPAGARAQRVGSNVVHRALSYAGGKWKMLKGWAVSTRGGLLVSRHKTKALAVKAAGK